MTAAVLVLLTAGPVAVLGECKECLRQQLHFSFNFACISLAIRVRLHMQPVIAPSTSPSCRVKLPAFDHSAALHRTVSLWCLQGSGQPLGLHRSAPPSTVLQACTLLALHRSVACRAVGQWLHFHRSGLLQVQTDLEQAHNCAGVCSCRAVCLPNLHRLVCVAGQHNGHVHVWARSARVT